MTSLTQVVGSVEQKLVVMAAMVGVLLFGVGAFKLWFVLFGRQLRRDLRNKHGRRRQAYKPWTHAQ